MEISLSSAHLQNHFGNNILICNWRSSRGMLFAGAIPKKEYVTVNVIGKKDVEKKDLVEFLNLPKVSLRLPPDTGSPDRVCQCSPKIAHKSARKPFYDRLVIVGDASCSRYYKNGIESAFMTAQIAAETAFSLGISKSAFRSGYFRRIKKQIIRDNLYGRALFRIYEIVYSSAFLTKVLMKVALDEGKPGRSQHLRGELWNMYTGNIPYSTILLRFLHPVLQLEFFAATVVLIITRFFTKAKIDEG